MAGLKEFLAGLNAGYIYTLSIFSTLFVIGAIFFADEKSFFYRMASKLLGSEPESGDGAFQFPIGWLLMIGTSIVLGSLIAFLITKYR